MTQEGCPARPPAGYDAFYAQFDAPLMQQIRREAYGQDIGQHSWVTAEELAQDLPRLRLTRTSRLLDLGCGPGGPLTFVVGARGRRATGIDASPAAIASAAARAEALGLRALIDVHVGDANAPLPFVAGSFTAVLAIDVVLHLRGRAAAFADIARLLAPGGRVVFTDAGVITGVVSNEEIARRSLHGFTQFAAPGVNEELLKRAGLRLLERVDRTPSLLTSARGRLVARRAHQRELEQAEGAAAGAAQVDYLETVVALAARGAVARVMYLAEAPVA